ncbi:hypothetical protein AAES_30444 [Amazona aestiva]|uniref:Uncharacterized protein n=1 Tax=Amazona aestiva TaxID=12930 RepID=A0A0Q3RAV2_AMAAE|nr:hypothetical protein AAES_30444 [Amazona aestiva]
MVPVAPMLPCTEDADRAEGSDSPEQIVRTAQDVSAVLRHLEQPITTIGKSGPVEVRFKRTRSDCGGGCRKEPAVVAALENSQNSIPNTYDVSALLSALPDLTENMVKGGCHKEPAAAAGHADNEDTIPAVCDVSALLYALPDLSKPVVEGGCPRQPAVVVGNNEDTVPNICDTSALLNALPDLSENIVEGGCPQAASSSGRPGRQ